MKRHQPPKWVKDLFIHEPSNYYDHWVLLWSVTESHMCYEITLCENDKGFSMVFGSCSRSYAGNWCDWQRCNMGQAPNWTKFKHIVRGLFDQPATNIWQQDDRTNYDAQEYIESEKRSANIQARDNLLTKDGKK